MKTRLAIIVLLILPLFISCSLLGLKRHVMKLEEHGIVAVQVSPAPSGSAPTYALAWTPVAAGVTQSVGFQRVGSNGLAAFSLLLSNTYSVGAFTDENGKARKRKHDRPKQGRDKWAQHQQAAGQQKQDDRPSKNALELSFAGGTWTFCADTK